MVIQQGKNLRYICYKYFGTVGKRSTQTGMVTISEDKLLK